MNCFTLEASMYGYINKERRTIELTKEDFELMGTQLGNTILQYVDMIDEDDRIKSNLKR